MNVEQRIDLLVRLGEYMKQRYRSMAAGKTTGLSAQQVVYTRIYRCRGR